MEVKSVAYGKAFVDLFASLKGPVDNLNMRGRLNVLSSTDIGYILRDSPLTTDNHLDNLVKGAAGQAVQNFNIACGFEERMGLDFVPIYP